MTQSSVTFDLSCFQDDVLSISDMSSLQAPLDIPIPEPPPPEDEVRASTASGIIQSDTTRWI